MRKIIYWVHTSVDGFFDGPDHVLDWPLMGPELSAYSQKLNESVGTLMYGRVVYQVMVSYWPTADTVSDHPHDIAYAPLWRRTPKIVVTNTLTEADWDTRVISGAGLAGKIAALKAEPGKDILLTGGTGLAVSLTELGLIDEYQIIVHPVLLTGGTPVLAGVKDRLKLRLLETRTLDDAVVLHRYERGQD
ncbi:riboflavin biosynthesis protein RibD [Acrocarpospora corrugata]|uniref:Riboflavin biosynthesis protein RibD n=1 Tax=Acrocarpospora corrugata TaxID=35763 RepID=A0A5M3VZK2_9ACTN|nr:dihydrofolate reductase family protein [Acrocarpospora corrugata]GES00271.1 riboflavin biosynthesis protein RibD [Acrocarpospora corrugata]